MTLPEASFSPASYRRTGTLVVERSKPGWWLDVQGGEEGSGAVGLVVSSAREGRVGYLGGSGVVESEGVGMMSGFSDVVLVSSGRVLGEDGGSTVVEDVERVSRCADSGYSSANLTNFLRMGAASVEEVPAIVDSSFSVSSSWKRTFFVGIGAMISIGLNWK
jgi:hypothetical protein